MIWEKMVNYLKNNVFPSFKDFDQYLGEDQYYVPEAEEVPMICLVNYREENDTPYMIVFKHGLCEEKQ